MEQCRDRWPRLTVAAALCTTFFSCTSADTTSIEACDEDVHVTMAAVGDILLHNSIQKSVEAASYDPAPAGQPELDLSAELDLAQARLADVYDDLTEVEQRGGAAYQLPFSYLADDLARADLTFANLEQPLAHGLDQGCNSVDTAEDDLWDNVAYRGWEETGFASLNAHPSVALALRALGVDVVSTANNHALDRCELGADRTLDALERAQLPSVGTARQADALEENPFDSRRLLVDIKGIKVAILAYGYGTNRRIWQNHQVSAEHFGDGEFILIEEDIVRTRSEPQPVGLVIDENGDAQAPASTDPVDVDLVVVSLHWGLEGYTTPVWFQYLAFERFAELGADAIIGHHPHVLEPVVFTDDGETSFAGAYSLGNFLAGQTHMGMARRTAGIVYLDLAKNLVTGQARVADVGWLPTYIAISDERRNDTRILSHYVIPDGRDTPFSFPPGAASHAYSMLGDQPELALGPDQDFPRPSQCPDQAVE